MKEIPKEFRLESFSYELPEERIAQSPAQRRDASRLLVLDRRSGRTSLDTFASVAELIPAGALVVANNSKVLPARLYGHKASGGRVEFLLLTPLPLVLDAAEQGPDGWAGTEVVGLLRASKAPKPGDVVTFGEDLRLTVRGRGEFGRCCVDLAWRGDLAALFHSLGHYPLPPYIRRPDTPEDALRYQTVYADQDKLGSVAAPTAGLHFTPEVRARLAERGVAWREVTLYVGYGTFSPVRSKDIREHEMHKEFIEVPQETAAAVAAARAEGRPVVAVGTTSVRALEGAFAATGAIGPYVGWTGIYITPGYRFRTVDALLTNFHLPESSLLIMVSALAGRENILAAYETALANEFRFFSYGDAMFIR